MSFVLFTAAGLVFALFPAGAPLALRCGLNACLRFSPRAALALASMAGLSGSLCALLGRGLRQTVVPGQHAAAALAGFLGGTAGRALLLMYASRFSGSLELARAQAVPLLLLAGAGVLSAQRQPFLPPQSRRGFFSLALLSAAIDGLLGAGGTALSALVRPDGVRRRQTALSSAALLASACAQGSALLLTLFSGAAQVFPPRIPLALALGAAAGSWLHERQKRAGPAGLRAALCVYLMLAALACAEQAFL